MASPFGPASPGHSHRHPGGTVGVVKAWPGALPLQNTDLLPQGYVIDHQIGLRPKGHSDYLDDNIEEQE